MIRAVIFDCDGVLVDSEVLIHAIELEALAELGMHYESGPFKARFLGMSNADYYAALDEDAMERLGRPIQQDMRPTIHARVRAVFDRELAAVPGAREAVDTVHLPKAVASSSGVAALDYKLKRLALWAERYSPTVMVDARAAAQEGLLIDMTGGAHLFGGEAALLADIRARLKRAGIASRVAEASGFPTSGPADARDSLCGAGHRRSDGVGACCRRWG